VKAKDTCAQALSAVFFAFLTVFRESLSAGNEAGAGRQARPDGQSYALAKRLSFG
jgi:hypothetical protein